MTPIARLLIPSFAVFALFTTTITAVAGPPSKNPREAVASMSANIPPTSLIDINSASLTDLRSLPSVGTVSAKKIVAGRPYSSVDDLKTRKILPKGTYDKIRDRISVKRNGGVAAGQRSDMSVPGQASTN